MTTTDIEAIVQLLQRNHGQVKALARSFGTVRRAAHKSFEQAAAVLTKLDQLETRIDGLARDVKALQQNSKLPEGHA